jgi:hypothetical protein
MALPPPGTITEMADALGKGVSGAGQAIDRAIQSPTGNQLMQAAQAYAQGNTQQAMSAASGAIQSGISSGLLPSTAAAATSSGALSGGSAAAGGVVPASANSSTSLVRSNIDVALPKDSGQYWVEYDLRPYTKNIRHLDHPQQGLVDWILRETGTDIWFSQPFGILNADRDTLRVYHTAAMHQVVADIHERFVNGSMETQVFGLRLIVISNPNWRNRATTFLRSVQVQTPGVNAWLLSKEDMALMMGNLRGRTDYKEAQAVDIVVHNGQTQTLEQLRGKSYVREYQRTEQGVPPFFLPVSAEVKEGYRVQFSPMLSVDMRTVDLAIKCSVDQIERLHPVTMELPYPNGQTQSVQIQVPQMASWQMHERFRWPADHSLLLSCGILAAPNPQASPSLLTGGVQSLGLGGLIPPSAAGARADALLLIEYKGRSSTQVGIQAGAPNAQQATLSRGRY